MKRFNFLVLILLLVVGMASTSEALTFTVNTTSDTVDANLGDGICTDGSGNCSLRAAIQEHNNSAASDNHITLPAGTYTLTRLGALENLSATGDLDIITGDLTIHGSNATIDGNGIDRVFDITNIGATVSLNNVTVTNGVSSSDNGGGIDNWGVLTLDNCTISGNTTDGNGGAIYNARTLVLTDTTIRGNYADGYAGGIFNNNSLTIYSSTINGNSDGSGDGGITNQGSATFVNTTISGNAGNGIRNTAGVSVNATISRCTIASNSDIGYSHSQFVSLYSTIVADNGTDCANVSIGTFTNSRWNLDSDDTCGLSSLQDLPDTDPMLGPLQDNGGPTHTHALLSGSPAIDASEPNVESYDQRGTYRPQDGDGDIIAVSDIGAFEAETTTSPINMDIDGGSSGGCFISVGGGWANQ